MLFAAGRPPADGGQQEGFVRTDDSPHCAMVSRHFAERNAIESRIEGLRTRYGSIRTFVALRQPSHSRNAPATCASQVERFPGYFTFVACFTLIICVP